MKLVLFPLFFVLLSGAALADTIYFNDTFNRGDSNTVGGGWSETDASNFLRIASNQLYLVDTSNSATGYIDAALGTDVTSGTGLYYNLTVKLTDATGNSGHFQFLDDGVVVISLFFDSGEDLWSYTGTTSTETAAEVKTMSAGTTYKISLKDWDMVNYKFDIVVDGTEYNNSGNHYTFNADLTDGIDTLRVNTNTGTQITGYYDNIKFYAKTATGYTHKINDITISKLNLITPIKVNNI